MLKDTELHLNKKFELSYQLKRYCKHGLTAHLISIFHTIATVCCSGYLLPDVCCCIALHVIAVEMIWWGANWVIKKVVCSCLQDLDLEWHMNFSPFFIRTMAKHTA